MGNPAPTKNGGKTKRFEVSYNDPHREEDGGDVTIQDLSTESAINMIRLMNVGNVLSVRRVR